MRTRTILPAALMLFATALAVGATAVPADREPVAEAAVDEDTRNSGAIEAGFRDDWQRTNGMLGNGWVSAHDAHRHWWDPLALFDESPVNTDPDKGKIGQPDNAAGRTAAYQDFGAAYADGFSVSTWWNGKHQAVAFPVVCISPEDPDWGLAFCYEPEIAGGVWVLWALGRQPHQIRLIRAGTLPGSAKHTDGTRMLLEMCVSGNTVTCLSDGKEILQHAIPAALRGSTMHGFGLDVNPVPGRPPNVHVLDGPFIIRPLERAPK